MSTNGTAQNGTNGHANGHANGLSNGHSNGHTNGHTNGSSKPVNNAIPSFTSQEEYRAWIATRLHVDRSPKAFASRSLSLVSLPPGAVFAPMLYTTPAPKAYSSVQSGRDEHFELNSDLVFINHGCDPSLEFDTKAMVIRVSRGRGLEVGDELTFWYPSSEWVMDQPFECVCRSGKCKGLISGAGKMDRGMLGEYWLNEHIERMLEERNGNGVVGNGTH